MTTRRSERSIPKFAIQEFLSEPRDDHDWMKELSDRELDDAIHDLNPRPWMPERFDKHQKVGFLLGLAYPQFSFFYDMGTGKTLLTLTLLRYLFDLGRINKALVTALNDEAIDGWLQQIEQWKVGLSATPLFTGSSDSKWASLAESERGLILIGYPGFRNMVSAKEGKKRGDGNELKKVPAKLLRLVDGVKASVWDESTELGNTDSLTFSVARAIVRHTPWRYALAGQPFGKDPTMLWAQQFLIDGGASLGPTKGLFREAFFSKRKRRFGGPYSYDYAFRHDMAEDLRRMRRHRSIAYDESECGTLPDLMRNEIKVSFPSDAKAYYAEQLKRLRGARGDYREMQNAFIKMRQISSGFLGARDDETGEKIELEFDTNPKRARLMDLALQVPAGRKFIVFYEFTHSGRRIVEALKGLGFNPVWIWSGTEDTRGDISAFKSDSMDVDCAVLNWRVGAFSLNLQRANYEFVFETPVGLIQRRQMIKRIWRKGQGWLCHLYDFITEGTYDQRILQAHKDGVDFFEAVMRDSSLA